LDYPLSWPRRGAHFAARRAAVRDHVNHPASELQNLDRFTISL